MKPIRIDPTNMPALAYSDGTHSYCVEWDCYTDRANLKECGKIPGPHDWYTPILRCSECGRLYFGNPTPIPRADNGAITAREEEQNAIIRADEEATRAEMQKKEAEQRSIERAEIEAHEAKQNGDIILPHLLTV